MHREATLLITYMKSIEGYFDGALPLPRNMVDKRITFIYDHLGSWVDLTRETVVSYNLSVLYDFAKGDRIAFITSMQQSARSLAARCIPIVEELGHM